MTPTHSPWSALIRLCEGGIKRRSTFRYWEDLERSQWNSLEDLQQKQLGSLRSLLAYAFEHVPYYRNKWYHHDLTPAALTTLSDFSKWPLLNREQFRAESTSIRSNEKGLCTLHQSTGGSTGQPLQFLITTHSYEQRNAATFRGYGWAGAEPGTRQFYLWGAALSPTTWRTRLKDSLYNGLYRRTYFNTFDLSPTRLAALIQALQRSRPKVIVAYSSALYHFAQLCKTGNVTPFSPSSIVVGAEKLFDFQRHLIEDVFRAPVFETYGSREFMLIAAECSEHRGLHVTMENLVVEVVDDKGCPVPPGQEGNIAVTDLTNYATPFIRYLIGDRGIASPLACSCGRGLPLLKEVTGRVADTICTPDGKQVSGLIFPHMLKDFEEIERFQVKQDTIDAITVSLVLNERVPSRLGDIETQLRSVLGTAIEIRLEPTAEIRLTMQGKHRVVISNLSGRLEKPPPAAS